MKAFVVKAQKNLQLDVHKIETLEILEKLKMGSLLCHLENKSLSFATGYVATTVFVASLVLENNS